MTAFTHPPCNFIPHLYQLPSIVTILLVMYKAHSKYKRVICYILYTLWPNNWRGYWRVSKDSCLELIIFSEYLHLNTGCTAGEKKQHNNL